MSIQENYNPGGESVSAGSGKRNLSPLLLLLLTAMVLLTYRNVFDNSFVDWDDYTYVVENDLVRNPDETSFNDIFTTPVSLNYHPLTILSLRLNNNKCSECPEGISPAPFIRWNVIIHILNTLLVFYLVFLLSGRKTFASFLVAAIFGVHPMHVESVAWISERKDLLYSFFYLSGLICWIRYRKQDEKNRRAYLLYSFAILLYVVSCLSKAMAVSFPLILLLLDFWMKKADGENASMNALKGVFSKASLLALMPFFLLSLIFGIAAVSINNPNTFSLLHRIEYAGYGFVMYIVKFLVPFNLSPLYPYPSQGVVYTGISGILLISAPLIFASAAVIAVWSLKRTKLFVFGLGFFFVSVMMVLQIISVGAAIMADRYTYLAYIGLAFIPAILIEEQVSRIRLPLSVISYAFIICMMVLSSNQVSVWNNSETLWNRVLKFYPGDETARSIRGIYYLKRAEAAGNDAESKEFKVKAFDDFRISIKTGTNRADVWEGAGCIYGEKGKTDSALFCLDKAIQIRPEKGSVYFNRAIVYGNVNRNDEAINDYGLSLQYQPENAMKIINNRSNLYLITGRYREAIRDFDYLVTKERGNYIYYYNRAFAKQQLNDISGALADYLQALELKPDDQMSRMQLEKILEVKKKQP
jgi:protein O-mannosyl-transferase